MGRASKRSVACSETLTKKQNLLLSLERSNYYFSSTGWLEHFILGVKYGRLDGSYTFINKLRNPPLGPKWLPCAAILAQEGGFGFQRTLFAVVSLAQVRRRHGAQEQGLPPRTHSLHPPNHFASRWFAWREGSHPNLAGLGQLDYGPARPESRSG